MKKIIFLFVLALTVCACNKDSDEYSSNSIVGFWSDIAGSTSNKNSMYHFDGNNCYNYLYSSDSEAFGDLEVWCDDVYPYLYDSTTLIASLHSLQHCLRYFNDHVICSVHIYTVCYCTFNLLYICYLYSTYATLHLHYVL